MGAMCWKVCERCRLVVVTRPSGSWANPTAAERAAILADAMATEKGLDHGWADPPGEPHRCQSFETDNDPELQEFRELLARKTHRTRRTQCSALLGASVKRS